MARIRSVKPEFWTAEKVMELSRDARLLFIGMWNFCDDRGVHPASFKTLKAQVFPSDEVGLDAVGRWVEELLEVGLLAAFCAEGRQWWCVTGWHHQVINRPSRSRYPAPPHCEALKAQPGLLNEAWMTEGRGGEEDKEGKGEEGSKEGVEEGGRPVGDRLARLVVRLRALGVDAPRHLSSWPGVLSRFEDEEIMRVAQVARERKGGERLHLHYLVPMLEAQGERQGAVSAWGGDYGEGGCL